MDRQGQSAGFWLGVFIGAIIGVGSLLLLSTKEGRVLLHDLWHRLEKILGEWEERFEEVEKQAEEKKEVVIEQLGEVKEKVTEKVEEAKVNVIDQIHKEVHHVAGLPEPSPTEGQHTSGGGLLGHRFFKKNGTSMG